MLHHIYLPGWGFFIVVAALYIFYATNGSRKARRDYKRKYFKEKQQEILEMMKKRSRMMRIKGSI